MAFVKYIFNNKYFKISPRSSNCKANKSNSDDSLKNRKLTVSYLPNSAVGCLPDSSADCLPDSTLPDSSPTFLPNSSIGCLPNVWKIRDPFEPHSSLVREILEESNQRFKTSNLDQNISIINSEYIEKSADVNEIKTYNNSSGLIENDRMVNENAQQLPATFGNYEISNKINKDRNLSALVQNGKMVGVSTQQFQTNLENTDNVNSINKNIISALIKNDEIVGKNAQQFKTNFGNTYNVNEINNSNSLSALIKNDEMVGENTLQFQTNLKNPNNVNEINNSNNLSALIKNFEMIGENAPRFQANFENTHANEVNNSSSLLTLIKNDKIVEENTQQFKANFENANNVYENNLSALINKDKMFDDVTENYNDNFSDTSTNSEYSFKTARSCVTNRHCFNKEGENRGKTEVELQCNKQKKKSFKDINQFSLKSDSFEISHKNECVDQQKDICQKLMDPNCTFKDLKNLHQRIHSSEFNYLDESLRLQPTENGKWVYSKTQLLKQQSQNSEINNSDHHLDSVEQIKNYSSILKYKVDEEKSMNDIDQMNDLNICCKSSNEKNNDHLLEIIEPCNSYRDQNSNDDFGENFVFHFAEPANCDLDITYDIAAQDEWNSINKTPDLNLNSGNFQTINKGNLLKRNLPSNSNRDNKRLKVNSMERMDFRPNDAAAENLKDKTPHSDKSNSANQILNNNKGDLDVQNNTFTSRDSTTKETLVYNINKTADLNMIPKKSAAINDNHPLQRNPPSNCNCYYEHKPKEELNIQIRDLIKEKDGKEIHLKTRDLVNGSPSPHSNISNSGNQNYNIDIDYFIEQSECDNSSGNVSEESSVNISKMIDLNVGLKSFEEESIGNLCKRIRSSDSNCYNKRLKLELEEKPNAKIKDSDEDTRGNPNNSDERFTISHNQEHENSNIDILNPVCNSQQITLGYNNKENTNKVSENENYVENIKLIKTINNSSVNELENAGVFTNNLVSPSKNCSTDFHPGDNNYKSSSPDNIFSNIQDTIQTNKSTFLFYNRYNMVSNSTQTDLPNMNNSGNSDKAIIDETLNMDDASKHIHNISTNSGTNFVELPLHKHTHNESHEEKNANTIESQAPSNAFQNIGESALGECSFETAQISTSKSTPTMRSTESYLSKESIEKLNEYYPKQQTGDRNPYLVEYVNDWMKSSIDPEIDENTTCSTEGNNMKPDDNLNGGKKVKTLKALRFGKNPRKRKTNKSRVHKTKIKGNVKNGLSNFVCPLILKRPVRKESRADFSTSTLKSKNKPLTCKSNSNNQVPQQVNDDKPLTSKINSNNQIEKDSQLIPQNAELQSFVVKTTPALKPVKTIKLVNDGQVASTSKCTEKSYCHGTRPLTQKTATIKFNSSDNQLSEIQVKTPPAIKPIETIKLVNDGQVASTSKCTEKSYCHGIRLLKQETATIKFNCSDNQLSEIQVKTPPAVKPIATIKLVNDEKEASTSKCTEKSYCPSIRPLKQKTATISFTCCDNKLSEIQSRSVNIRPPRQAKTNALLKLKQIINDDHEACKKKSGPKRNLKQKSTTKKLKCCNNQLPEFQSNSENSRPPRDAKTNALLKLKKINFNRK